MPLKISQKFTVSQKQKLYLRIRTASILELRENEYANLVNRIETNPLFEKMMSEYGILAITNYSDTHLASRFCGLIENINPESCPPEIDSIIEENKNTVSLIKQIGMAKFEEYFLKNDKGIDYNGIQRECGISKKQAAKINCLVNSLGVYGEFYFPSAIPSGTGKYFSKIAQIEKRDGTCQAHYFIPHYVKGKYLVDYENLKIIRKSGVLSHEQSENMNHLVMEIEAVNKKKNAVYETIKYILKKQELYFSTGNPENILYCTQKEAAADIDVEESTLSRILDSRSVGMPDGTEKALGYFFQSRKEVGSRLVRHILQKADRRMTDIEIMKELRDNYHIDVSRRTVNLYRKARTGA